MTRPRSGGPAKKPGSRAAVASPLSRPFRRILADVLADLVPVLRWDAHRGLAVDGSGHVRPDAALAALRDYVYANCFCRWAPPGPDSPGADLSPHVSGDAEFVSRLTKATGGARYWDHGWRSVAAGDTYAFVSDGQIMLFVDEPGAVWPESPAAGDPVSVLIPCARERLSPGFFYLIGTRGRFDRTRPYPRLYLNVAPEAAPDLVAALLEDFGRRGVAFEAKFANDPAAYCRVDPAVLYLGQADYAEACSVMRGLVRQEPGWWRDGTPLFALPLDRGLAAAECPQHGEGAIESFGHHRCRLLAQGVIEALAAGERAPAAVLARVASVFETEGLSLEHPHTHHLPADFWESGAGPT